VLVEVRRAAGLRVLDRPERRPARVVPLPWQTSPTIASANRLSILLGDRTPSWCVLHELAHAMTSHADGRSDGHGPVFMGVYVRLIVRYLGLDPQTLNDSLRDAGIEIIPYFGSFVRHLSSYATRDRLKPGGWYGAGWQRPTGRAG
jgi:hypothetical protein